MIKVSIIVPVYKTASYLKKCLDSLVNQTLKEIEIIVVNDCSPDNSADIIASYSDSRMVVINHKKNMGIGRTRNDGIKRARGKYIAFVDSDDYVKLNMYEEYYKFAEVNELEVVSGYYEYKTQEKYKILKNNYFAIGNLHENPQLLNIIDYGPCNKMFSRDLIIKNQILFNEKLKFEDVPFILKAIYQARTMGHINVAYYYYVVRQQSETTSVDVRNKDIFLMLVEVNEYYKLFSKLELEYFNINQITINLLKQRCQKDKKLRYEMIEKCYQILDDKFPNWRNNQYLKQESFFIKLVKKNKWLLYFYCFMYRILPKNIRNLQYLFIANK